MVVATKAIVFSAIKYSEADLISNCYTEVAGVKSYLLRNILKSKRGKLKSSYFQPLTQLELIAEHKNKGTLEYIKEAKVFYPYQTLHTDILKTGLVMFLSEMLKNCIREEEPNHELYTFLEQSFQWLDQNDEVANFHIFFLLQLSQYLGFYPDASNIEDEYFNIMEGNFQSKNTSNYCLEGVQIENFKLFFGINPSTLNTVKLSKKERQNLLEFILSYYSFHVQGYQKPKSLAVLMQLFS
ncbi:DNA replication and repair protein RecO [Aequorivita sublithincola DSM 14238]|uniref:DNA repair protein RecO n=1 Tax=Aequorivita sublithincola (strain DSM 14238 / LMG 21431 / ACAM 643 / 9-3) TaxID=746697 RepID=I3YVL8_AEQSU|nr:DNA repair protein RecO [Aequorivita sublithincola]AFL81036.1 DNA replication and repair protein RecO [Aequorivita sublithincola DSM 14238]